MLAISRGKNSNWMGEIVILSTPACNLQCLGCVTSSNYAINDPYTKKEKIEWIKTLHATFSKNQIDISGINLQGGELFINDDFLDIARLIGEIYPDKKIMIFTNGMLISKHLDWLDELIKNPKVEICITLHKIEDSTPKELARVLMRLKNAGTRYSVKGLDLPGFTTHSINNFWRMPYNFSKDGMKVHPMEQNDLLMSWATCSEKYQNHLIDHKLYKCTKLAYLRPMLAKLGQLSDDEWQHYLGYKPLDLRTATFTDIAEFASKTVESYCNMCPSDGIYTDNDKPIYKKDYADWLSTNGVVKSL
jgi:sulfatase maturation enzyme AslB (radical SAM superfamily)